jgi:hypothetical protein
LALRGVLQAQQRVGPHLVDHRGGVAQTIEPRSVQPTRAGNSRVDQSGVSQDAQVLRNRRSADRWEVPGDLTGGQLVVADQPQDGASGGVGDGAQRRVDGSHV